MARSRQVKHFEARLAVIPARVKEAVRPALEKSADELVASIQTLVPVDEGDLKKSIQAFSTEFSTQIGVSAGTDNEGAARHARWVEFGTPEAPQQAFFYPSIRLLQKRINQRIKAAIRKAVKQEFTR